MKRPLFLVIKVFLSGLLVMLILAMFFSFYLLGYQHGVSETSIEAGKQMNFLLSKIPGFMGEPYPQDQITDEIIYEVPATPSWGGPALWEQVNIKRVAFGVNPLGQKDEMCTIASIRLNELLRLGDLDGHEGFGKLADSREDLKWIFEKYNLSEFLVMGAQSAEDAVGLWENTLAHRKLLTGGEYVWGCTYAQDGMGVAIVGF